MVSHNFQSPLITQAASRPGIIPGIILGIIPGLSRAHPGPIPGRAGGDPGPRLRPAAPPCGRPGRCRPPLALPSPRLQRPALSGIPAPGTAAAPRGSGSANSACCWGFTLSAPGHTPGVRIPEIPRVYGGLLSQQVLPA